MVLDSTNCNFTMIVYSQKKLSCLYRHLFFSIQKVVLIFLMHFFSYSKCPAVQYAISSSVQLQCLRLCRGLFHHSLSESDRTIADFTTYNNWLADDTFLWCPFFSDIWILEAFSAWGDGCKIVRIWMFCVKTTTISFNDSFIHAIVEKRVFFVEFSIKVGGKID